MKKNFHLKMIAFLVISVCFTLPVDRISLVSPTFQLKPDQLSKKEGKWYYFEKGQKIPVKELISRNNTLFDLPEGVSSRIEKEDTDELGMKHYLLKLEINGIPIEDGFFSAHYSKDGDLLHVVGKYNKSIIPKEKTLPAITRNEAFLIAKDAFILVEKIIIPDYQKSVTNELTSAFNEGIVNPQLVYFRSEKLTNLTLSYKVDIITESVHRFITFYIDAVTGSLLHTVDHRTNAIANVQTVYNGPQTVQVEWRGFPYNYYYLRHEGFSTPIETRNSRINDFYECVPYGYGNLDRVHKSNTSWPLGYEANAASSHWAVKEAYTVFKNNFGRTFGTFSSAGGEIRMENNYTVYEPFYEPGSSYDYIHVGQTEGTAGFEGSLDVIAHEFTHGVMYRARGVDRAAYDYEETGALCESFADIFGILVEYYTTGSTDYTSCSNLLSYFRRSIQNPRTYQFYTYQVEYDPNCVSQIINLTGNTVPLYRYESPYWIYGSGSVAAHSNCSVQNYWFYLLANGGSQRGVTVNGIGLNYASQIAYRNMVYYFSLGSDFDDMRQASIVNAATLYGECSNPYDQVQNAWAAVGVGAQATGCLNVQIYRSFPYLFCGEQGYFTASVIGGSGNYSYQWNVDYSPYSNQPSFYLGWYPQSPGEYHFVSLEVTEGSLYDSDGISVYVYGCDGERLLQSGDSSERIKLNAYPNPASSYTKLVVEDDLTQEIKDYTVDITDNYGRVVYSTRTSAKESIINTSKFQKGIYTAIVKTGKKYGSLKLILE